MPLTSARFAGVPELEACALDDSAHLLPGSFGSAVALVQQALLDFGQDLGPSGADGDYGPATEAAVTGYKTDRNILNDAGQIDPIVGKLTIASLDSDIDAYDTQVEPCLSDPIAGPAIDLSLAPEPAVNALFGMLGMSSLIEVDGDGASSILLNLANTDPDAVRALGNAATSAIGLFATDASPAQASLTQTLPQLTASPALAPFPTVTGNLGSIIDDITNLVTGAQLLLNLLPQTGAPGTPARDLTKAQALAIAVVAHTQGIIAMNPAPVVDPTGAITSPAPTDTIDIGTTIGAVAFFSVQFADKRFPPNHPTFPYNPQPSDLRALDVRNLIGLIRLANHLNATFGATEIHHAGISGSRDPNGDCHRQGRAVDFVGVKGTKDGTAFHLTVLNDWALKSVPNLANPAKPRLPDWPAATRPLEYRLDSDPAADPFVRDFFKDLYAAVAGEFQDQTAAPGQTAPASTIGSTTFIMNPDHPTSAPGTKHGREAHRGHVHFQIGPTGTQGP